MYRFAHDPRSVVPAHTRAGGGANSANTSEPPDVWRPRGFALLHVTSGPQREDDLNWSRPLLSQRRYWMRDDAYSKPTVLRRAVRFSMGFHQLREKGVHEGTHPHLRLLHLHYADHASCWQRELAKHADYKRLGSPSTERKVTRETKDWFNAMVRKGMVCCYANVSSHADAHAQQHGLSMTYTDSEGHKAHPVEIIHPRWHVTIAL